MIEITNLSKRIGHRQLFENFNLSIADGEMLAITGASGSGKTTLLNILGFIDSDYEGTYRFDGQDKVKANSSKAQKLIREKIGYLFQNFALIDHLTVEKNLSMALKYVKKSKTEKRQAIEQVLAKVGLSETLHQKVSELSGGEQQRIAIARTLLKPSQVILADEPTGALDEGNKEKVLELLKELHQDGRTIIIVTHDLALAQACSRHVSLTPSED